MAPLTTDASNISRTASSGLQAEAIANSSEVATAVGVKVKVKVSTRASSRPNAVDRLQTKLNRIVRRPPHRRDLGSFSTSFRRIGLWLRPFVEPYRSPRYSTFAIFVCF